MKKILTIIIASVCISAAAAAQALPSLLVNSDPKAMGAAGMSLLGSDAYALQGYAASAALMDATAAAGVSYGIWQPAAASDKVLGASAAVKLAGKFSIALDYKNFMQPEYELMSPNGSSNRVTPVFKPGESSYALGLGFAFVPGLSAAVTVRSTGSKLSPDAKASAFGVDVSAMFSKDKLKAALAVCNLGGQVKYGEKSYAQPMLVKAGAAFNIVEGLKTGAEFSYLFEGVFNASAGVEYSYKGIVAARAGYHFGDKAKGVPSFISLGLGAGFKGVQLNAAYLLASETLAGSMLFGLSYAF